MKVTLKRRAGNHGEEYVVCTWGKVTRVEGWRVYCVLGFRRGAELVEAEVNDGRTGVVGGCHDGIP